MRRRSVVLAAAVLVVGTGLLPAGARADGTLESGGAAAPGRPAVHEASCATQRPWTCARGQIMTLTGADLAGASAIVFLGGESARDDVRVTVRARAARDSADLLVVVPRRARSGPIRVVSALGAVADSPQPLTVVRQIPGIDDARGLRGLLAGGRRQATFAYEVTGTIPDGASVEAVRVADGAVVRRWPLEGGEHATGQIRWDGFAGSRPVASGAYLLRLDDAASAVATVAPGSDTELRVIEALFPIRGPHTIGRTAMQRFGGARGHQGQDTFARCGTPLAALSKGTVHYTGVQSLAGNYVVIDTPDGGSYAYMHLRDPALVQRGDTVYAGQRLGFVGDTGDAQGCHLHLELWSAPGWYRGGSPFDPLPSLVRWDATS